MSDKVERRVGMIELTYEVKNLATKIDENTEATKRIDKTLHGNGGDGLVTRMSLVEKMTDAHESSLVWGRRTVLGGFIVGLIYLLYHLVKAA